jgi:hypothetical protein
MPKSLEDFARSRVRNNGYASTSATTQRNGNPIKMTVLNSYRRSKTRGAELDTGSGFGFKSLRPLRLCGKRFPEKEGNFNHR